MARPMAIADPPQSARPTVSRPRLLLWRLLWPARSAAGTRRTARVPWIPIAIILAIVVMAIFAPLLAPHSPIDQTLRRCDEVVGIFSVPEDCVCWSLGS